MQDYPFTEWPGAWERQLIRAVRNPKFFNNQIPSEQQLREAQLRDQQELSQFNLDLGRLATECTQITEETGIDDINRIKKELDCCYDTACGLAAELGEQKSALSMLNDIITNAMRRAHRNDDEHSRLLLIKQESVRMRHLARLNYPIVCDLLRAECAILPGELPAAMLSETDEAFTVALDIVDNPGKQRLLEGIETVRRRLEDDPVLFRIDRKLQILHKRIIAIANAQDATETNTALQ